MASEYLLHKGERKMPCILVIISVLTLPLLASSNEASKDRDTFIASKASEYMKKCIEKLHDPGQEIRIAFLGDSITEKNLHTHEKANYFDFMECYFRAKNPRALVKNMGKSGRTTVTALDILDTEVIKFKPDLTYVMLGINDSSSWFNVTLEDYRKNLGTIITNLVENGSAVVVMTQNEIKDNPYDGKVTFTHYAEFAKASRDIAITLGVPCIDNYTQWQKLKKDDPPKFESYMNDWIHPNEEGHIFYYLFMRSNTESILSSTK